jgi:uncharacterized protein
MNFAWDERKNEVNIDKHGFDFADAYRIFDLPMAVQFDRCEDRWIGTGMLDGRGVVVICTEPDGDTVCIVSLRKALTHERKNYEQYIKNGLV